MASLDISKLSPAERLRLLEQLRESLGPAGEPPSAERPGRRASERGGATTQLQASQRLLAEIVDALPVRVFWKDRNLVYLGCNAAFARDAGLAAPRDIIGKTDQQLVWGAQASKYTDDDRQVVESGRPKLLIEEPQTTPEGRTITLLTSKVPLRDASGNISGVLGTYMDVTPMKRAEQSAARLAMAVEQAAETIMITDASGTILDVNPAFETTTGYSREEAIGRNPRMLKSGRHDDAFYQRMWAVLKNGQVWQGRLTNRRKDGRLYDEEVSIAPMRDAGGRTLSFVAVKRDVTRQEQMEAQLRRAQRLESIGTLAGGIAHDLNNALAPILMATELLRVEFPDRAAEDLALVEAGARRGADLVKQLLAFARGAEGERLPVQLRSLLDEMEQLIRSTFPKNIDLRIDCPADLPTILGDATQLHQVLLNLFVNARDAMSDGGTLSLEAGTTNVDGAQEADILKVTPGRYVVLRVTDTGSGIPPDVLDRIFDPFFTTKAPDKGTGLGLATTLGIVKGHGGFIRVYSTPGQGTTFTVYLPVYAGEVDDAVVPAASEAPFRGRGETVLVVDDDASVRDILRRVLTRLNFKVLIASNVTSALREVADHPAEIAAVITDLHMPEQDGMSFARVLRSRLPDAAVIVVSGLVGERERDQFARLGVRAVLDKPFTQADLVKALRTVFAR
jgi:PAS domain S-box-containing protein